jgi:hypothetical protein
MNLELNLPANLEADLASEAARLGVPLSECAVRLIAAGLSASPAMSTGGELLGYWQNEGLVGTRPEIEDSQAHARSLREQAERRQMR